MPHPPRKYRTELAWLLIWSVAGVAGFLLVPELGGNEYRARARAHQEALAQLKNTRQEAYDQMAQLQRLQEREDAARRNEELEKAMGGPVRVAFGNPALTLSQALRQAARASAPTNTSIEVEVSRFTEFTATVNSTEPMGTNQMIAMARNLMPLAGKYLETLRFSSKGAVTAELDRADIEFVSDWATVPDQRLVMLLAREVPVQAVSDPSAFERFRDEQRLAATLGTDSEIRKKAAAADLEFRAEVEKAFAELRSAIELSRGGISVLQARTLSDLDAREKSLLDAAAQSERARDFWSDPAKTWERLLDRNGLAGDAREELKKNFPNMFKHDPAKTRALFQALDGLTESGRFLLRTLADNQEKWRFLPAEELIEFREESFRARTLRARDQFREDARALENALENWQDPTVP